MNRKAADTIHEYYQLYFKDVLAFINWMVSDVEEAADICQEVFLMALKSLEGKPQQIKNPKAWLFHIARNRAINARKKRTKKRELFEQMKQETAVSYTTEERWIDDMLVEQVHNYVETEFTEKERLVFQLRFIHNMELKEIAEITGLYFTTVSKVLSKLVKKLAKHFEGFNTNEST